MKPARIALLAYALAATVAAVPVVVNPTLRATYVGLLAHWRAKVQPPRYVFIGDSITAGRGASLDSINLGESGLLTFQIVDRAATAMKYHPDAIVVMAGTNDAMHDIDPGKLMSEWDRLFAVAGNTPVIVTLAPLTADAAFNEKIAAIDEIARTAALEHSARIVDLGPELAPSGTLEPRYTVDGVHLTPAAYAVWTAKIGD